MTEDTTAASAEVITPSEQIRRLQSLLIFALSKVGRFRITRAERQALMNVPYQINVKEDAENGDVVVSLETEASRQPSIITPTETR